MTLEQWAARPIQWTSNDDAEFPYRATVEGVPLSIRINDFPDQSLYSLFERGVDLGFLDDWPSAWIRPAAQTD
jgi:hypothetical protein